MKYLLKAKGRTDKKTLTVNIGGEIKEYSKDDCLVDGIDVTSDITMRNCDPKFMSIEDNFVQKIKLEEQLKDFYSESDVLTNTGNLPTDLSPLDTRHIKETKLMTMTGPWGVPCLPYNNDYNIYSRICKIDNVYVVTRKKYSYISFDNGLSWERSELSGHFAGCTAKNSIYMPAFVYKDKFYIGAEQLFRTDKSLDQSEKFLDASILWADSDGNYIYASRDNNVNAYDENGVLHYSVECSSPYVLQCFEGIKGCFVFEGSDNKVSYIVEDKKRHCGYARDNSVIRVKAFGKYIVIDNKYIYDIENDIQREIKAYALIAYDFNKEKFVVLDYYGEIDNSSKQTLYEYDFESDKLSMIFQDTKMYAGSSLVLYAPDYHLFYINGPQGQGLYDISLNFIVSVSTPSNTYSLLDIFRFEYEGKSYDYYMSSSGSVSLVKNDISAIGNNIYIGGSTQSTVTNSNFGVAVADVDSGFDFLTLVGQLYMNASFDEQSLKELASICKIHKMRDSLTDNSAVYNLNFDCIYDNSKMVIEYTDGENSIKFIDKFKIVESYNISKEPTIDGRTLKSIDYIEFTKKVFSDIKGNAVKHAVIFNFE